SDTHIEAPQEWTLYQDSSGGENWDSDNHVDGQGRSTVTFRGYRVTYGPAAKACLIAEGDRASPALAVITASGTIGATVLEFWQNFPKAIRWSESTLDLGLFPWESCAPFALRGGRAQAAHSGDRIHPTGTHAGACERAPSPAGECRAGVGRGRAGARRFCPGGAGRQ
ncbi:hypothetical protein B1A_15341, partial [mine drainage metagenome]